MKCRRPPRFTGPDRVDLPEECFTPASVPRQSGMPQDPSTGTDTYGDSSELVLKRHL